MIEGFDYKCSLAAKEGCAFPWVAESEFLKKDRSISFKPGLNIIFGPNGSGKSSLLQMMGMTMAAVQGGRSCVTSSWIYDLVGFHGKEHGIPGKLRHDGQPIMYFDARAKEGIVGGSFDDDFFSLGFENSMRRGSTGQLVLARLDRMLSILRGAPVVGEVPSATTTKPKKKTSGAPVSKRNPGRRASESTSNASIHSFPTEIEYKVTRGDNSVWAAKLKILEGLFIASISPGPKTMLFDEPESGFSIDWQARFWSGLRDKVNPQEFQVIVATHSPFALGIEGANYIEMEEGYIKQSKNALRDLVSALG